MKMKSIFMMIIVNNGKGKRGREMSLDCGEINVSKICSDKRGTWWAIGTKREWFEFWVTPTGKFRILNIHKGKHPYFTKEKP